ncbi:MAG: YciI family protein [Armatimonadota bacterium]
MKDYLYLFRGGNAGTSPEERQKSMQRWGAWIEQLSKAGKSKGGFPLESGGKVVSGQNKLVTDGPFAESKEGVGGYLIVTANDLTDAVEISKGCPIFAEGGVVEIRPIMPM